jgi:hypothetical protein
VPCSSSRLSKTSHRVTVCDPHWWTRNHRTLHPGTSLSDPVTPVSFVERLEPAVRIEGNLLACFPCNDSDIQRRLRSFTSQCTADQRVRMGSFSPIFRAYPSGTSGDHATWRPGNEGTVVHLPIFFAPPGWTRTLGGIALRTDICQ